jgi:hypothetical protein
MSEKAKNSLTVYSSGTAVFTRTMKGRKVAIPVPKNACGDFAASVRVFGNTRIVEPVSWPQERQTQITLDPSDSVVSLLTQLVGHRVSFKHPHPVEGVNLGVQTGDSTTLANGSVVATRYLAVQVNEGITRHRLDEVTDITFPDAKEELRAVYDRLASKFRPDTVVASLTTDSEQEVVIQYQQPFPVWQPTYRIDLDDGKAVLEAFGKLDYTADDALTDCVVTLVVGEPDTFENDLSAVVTPTRSRVETASRTSQGGYVAQSGFEVAADALEAAGSAPTPKGGYARALGGAAPEGMSARLSSAMPAPSRRATSDQAVAREVGDFSTWTNATPLTLQPRSSCLIPLFERALKDTRRVLYYRHSVHPTRTKACVWLTNPTTQTLGVGVCSVYTEGSLAGTAVLQTTKPNEKTLLVYGTDTGVRVARKVSPVNNEAYSLRIQQGVAVNKTRVTNTTTYTLKNLTDKTGMVLIEHDRQIAHSTIASKSKVVETLENGVRLEVTLLAQVEVEVEVSEAAVTTQQITLGDSAWHDLYSQWLTARMVKNDEFSKVLAASEAANKKAQEIDANNREMARLNTTQARLTGYIRDRVGNDPQIQTWQTEVAANETAMRECEKKAATLQQESIDLQNKMYEALREVTVKWEGATK